MRSISWSTGKKPDGHVVEIQVTSIKFITEVDGPEHFKKA
jgi:hypothetical protein